MIKKKFIGIGIDVSKKSLDVSMYDGKKSKSFKFSNDEEGFVKLESYLSKIESDKLILMESTGIYHLKLAICLYKSNYKVGIINPFVIKKYSEMQMKRSKTDEIDARLISEYCYDYNEKIKLFEPNEEVQYEVEQLLKMTSNYKELLNNLNNQLEMLSYHPYPCKKIVRDVERQIENIKKSIKKFKEEIEKKLKKSYSKEYSQLMSIKGIGPMLASIIISKLNNFKNFKKAKSVCAYLGINPGVSESGTSVKGKGRIPKKGNKYIRKLLYMCSISAMRYNNSCKQLANRLKEKGKKWKEIVIAVANKLIRQAYGILKNGTFYDDNYCITYLNN